MDRLERLHKRIKKQRRRVKRLKSSIFTPPKRLELAQRRLRKTINRHERAQRQTLY
jgi:hypothetical protein